MTSNTLVAYTSYPWWLYALSAASLLLFGYLLRHWIRYRVFSRVNAHGVQLFKSYGHMLLTRAWEQVVFYMAQSLMFLSAVAALIAVARYFS